MVTKENFLSIRNSSSFCYSNFCIFHSIIITNDLATTTRVCQKTGPPAISSTTISWSFFTALTINTSALGEVQTLSKPQFFWLHFHFSGLIGTPQGLMVTLTLLA